MDNKIEFKLTDKFQCKRCGCTKYDKLIYTGLKTLDEEDAIIDERYVCRNCDFPIDISEYENSFNLENITITSEELLNNSIFIDEGTEVQINGETIKKENNNE